MAETSVHLLIIPHSLGLFITVGLRRTGQQMHYISVKGSLYSEDGGKCIHDAITCVGNTVQVTATSSPATF